MGDKRILTNVVHRKIGVQTSAGPPSVPAPMVGGRDLQVGASAGTLSIEQSSNPLAHVPSGFVEDSNGFIGDTFQPPGPPPPVADFSDWN